MSREYPAAAHSNPLTVNPVAYTVKVKTKEKNAPEFTVTVTGAAATSQKDAEAHVAATSPKLVVIPTTAPAEPADGEHAE